MFSDTENPVCLALFGVPSKRIGIYHDENFVGFLDDLEKQLPQEVANIRIEIKFNEPHGALGFIAFDDTRAPSIRFVRGDELAHYRIGFSSRMITRIDGRFSNLDSLVRTLNRELSAFRESTKDVFLTPFKGLRKDGHYRRRMDYRLARDFIALHADSHT
jgi:hypothetical protein